MYSWKKYFLLGPCKGVIREGNLGNRVSSVQQHLKRGLERGTEESPLLEAVSRERLVKTQQAGKDLECAVVICKVCRLAVTLQLL
jgi:hypothetical protein